MSLFGEKLKNLRSKKGITQEKLANDLDIPESSIRRLEISDGIPRMDRLKQIAEYFGVTTDYLLGKELVKENTKKQKFLDEIDNAFDAMSEADQEHLLYFIKKMTESGK